MSQPRRAQPLVSGHRSILSLSHALHLRPGLATPQSLLHLLPQGAHATLAHTVLTVSGSPSDTSPPCQRVLVPLSDPVTPHVGHSQVLTQGQ